MEKDQITGRAEELMDNRNTESIFRALQLVFLAMMVVSGSVFLASGPTERSLVLQNSSSMEHVEDNKFGSVIYYNRRAFPVYHSAENFRACIFTSADSPPIIKEFDGRNMVIGSDGVEEVDLNLSLSEEELGRSELNGTYSVESVEKCSIRSARKIEFVDGYSSDSS